MKKLLLVLLISCLILPTTIFAAEKKYNTLNLKEALADEEIEEVFETYKPNEDAINIYLFRGKGCGYCRAFLTFIDSITEEYGKYFNLVSYEVWNDADNAALMQEVSEYLGEEAGGVPYIVIGDKVFAGYANVYDEDIKTQITELYNTKKKNRYDVFEQMKKNPKKNKSTDNNITVNNVVVWNLIITFVATMIIISYINLKSKELNYKLDNLNLNSKPKVKESKKK